MSPVDRIGINHFYRCGLQVSSQGRHCWEDLLPSSADKDKAYGTVYHTERDDRRGTESIQRERDDHKV